MRRMPFRSLSYSMKSFSIIRMNRHLLLAVLLVMTAEICLAGVPKRQVITHTQPDGTAITLTASGNGRYMTYTTADGVALLRGTDGHYRYALPQENAIVASGCLAHGADRRTAGESELIRHSGTDAEGVARLLDLQNPVRPLAAATRSVASTDDGLGKYGTPGRGTVSSIGAPVIPVIMVNFADRAFADTINAAKVTRFFNEKGYADETGSKGSVKDYFEAQSNGMFSPSFEVVATVTVEKGYAYYGANSSSGSIDPKAGELVGEALRLAETTVDFSRFATDGSVPLVTVMFAGPGEQSSFEDGSEDYIWAHFSTRSFTVNGDAVHVNSYFVGNELLQSYGNSPNDVRGANIDGVGLFCHEFGHALGLPDFYYTGRNATVNDTLNTMNYWSIMDYGQYYYNGYAPVGYTAYERSFLGWLDVKELTEPQFAELYPFGQEERGATAYVLRNPECSSEYYLLENRQPSAWYPRRMGSGLLVTHVNYDASLWRTNTLNNDPEKPRMAFVPADNVKEGTRTSASLSMTQLFDGYKGDLFPGTQGVTSFTDETVPAATLQEGSAGLLGKPIYNIALTDEGVITFSFIDPSLISGIEAVETGDSPDAGVETPAYTPDGRRVRSLREAARGVYILPGGRKVMKK